MTNRKLFNVLVIGGALMGAGCDDPAPARDAGETAASDAAPASDATAASDAAGARDSAIAVSDGGGDDATVARSDASATPADGGELMECGFCPNEHCCVTDESGESHARDGMECCWGTSC